MGTLRNHSFTQGRRMPIATHEPFIAKQRSTVACIAHDLLPAYLRKHFVLCEDHAMGTWQPALHKAHASFLEVPPTCTFIVPASLLLYNFNIAQPALRTPYYQTEGLSSVRHTVELCESTMLLCHLRACCTEAPIMVSVGDTTAR